MFAKNVQFLRGSKNLTQKQLADALFVSDKTVSKWETGLNEPNIDMLKKVSQYFDVSVDDLITRDLSMAEMTQKIKNRFSKNIKTIVALNMAVIVGYLVSLALYVGLSENKYDYLGQGRIYVGIATYFIIAVISWAFIFVELSGMWKSLDKTNLVERKSFFKTLFLSVALLLYTTCNTLFGEHNLNNMANGIQYMFGMTLFCGFLIVLICSECYMNFVYKDKTTAYCTVYTVMQTLVATVLIPTVLLPTYSNVINVINNPDASQALLDEAYVYRQLAIAAEVILGILLVVLPLIFWLIKDRKFSGISLAHIVKNFISYMVLSAVAFVAEGYYYVEEKLLYIYLTVFLINVLYYIVLFKFHKKRYHLD